MSAKSGGAPSDRSYFRGGPDGLKSEAQIEAEKKLDPLVALQAFLEDRLDWDLLAGEVHGAVRGELQAALNRPEPLACSAQDYMFSESSGPSSLMPSERPGLRTNVGGVGSPSTAGPRINFVDAVRHVRETELERNDRLVIFGEDLGLRGGVHRATADLQKKFGENRVFDTSLFEEGIIGRATGMALAGLTPLLEIQFWKYADPAHEQIQDAGWLRWRTAGKFGVHISGPYPGWPQQAHV